MSAPAGRHRSLRGRAAGFTLLELIVVICVVAVLMSVALERLLRYQELAERAAMEQMAGTLRSAMHLRAAAYIATQRIERIASLATGNPFDWLAEKPANYAGARFDPAPGEVDPGNWYYDRKGGIVVYLPRSTRYFVAAPDGRKWVRYRVVYAEERLAPAGAATPLREITSLAIEPVEPYNWSPE